MIEDTNISLKPIIEADPVLYSFNTLGWKIVISLLIVMLIYFVHKYFQKYNKNKYRINAIKNITSLESKITDSEFVTQIMYNLKQTAIESYGRKSVAFLEGENWLKFLDDKFKDANFINQNELITSAIYKKDISSDHNLNREEFRTTSIKWIKNHA